MKKDVQVATLEPPVVQQSAAKGALPHPHRVLSPEVGRSWQRVLDRAMSAATRLLFPLSLVMALGAWEFAARNGLIDEFLSSKPTDVFQRAWEMFVSEGSIYPHLSASGRTLGLGLSLSLLVGVPAGIAVGWYRSLARVAEPYIMAMLSTPTIALLPLFIVWFGIGEPLKVVIIFLGAVFIVIVNTASGVRGVDSSWLEAAEVFCASRWRLFLDVILPASLPSIAVGARLAITRGLIMMFVAEMYASNVGIGFLVTDAGTRYQIDEMFVGVVVIAAIGVGLTSAMQWLEDRPLRRFHAR